jgi:acetylornithine deacetylase/succinyl-diaminopimelate desuccinylase-like protein
MTVTSSAERRYVTEHRDEWLTELMDWLRIPSISADPAYAADVARSADWLAAALCRAGFPTAEVLPTAGHPAVYAEWRSADPDAPTVLVYGHHDVQPVDPEELWAAPPFEPVVVGDELRGRGAIDDKGQVAFHLLGIRAHLAATGRSTPAVHLKVLVEGEEESGSPHFAELLRTHAERFACDVVVVSDTGVFKRGVPSVCTGMRGLLPCQIDVRGPDIDLHSGSFGGAVPNPLAVLADLVAGLHDEQGRVALPGFYDQVVPLTEAERTAYRKLPFDEADWLSGTARSRTAVGEAGYSTLERVWARPTAELNGIWGGYTGPGSKTIIPTDAHAKVSFRLVADQLPVEVERQLRRYLAARAPAGVRVDVHFESGVRPCLTPVEHPANQAVIGAMTKTFGQEVLLTREGGSGPEADLAEVLAAPVVFLGVGLPDDRFHAPNERAVLDQLYAGAEAAAYLWSDLAEALRPAAT